MIVVLHFCDKDETVALKCLKLCALMDGRVIRPIWLSFDDKTNPSAVERAANKAFSDVHLFEYEAHGGPPQWPQVQNWAFQQTARHVHSRKLGPWLWWEPDAIPLKPHWLNTIDQEYHDGAKPFMGHIVDGMGHMNGVGVYPESVQKYTNIALRCRVGAWDYAMKDEMIHQCHRANHLFQHVWNLDVRGLPANRQGDGFTPATFPTMREVVSLVNFSACMFHRNKDGTLADRLSEIWGTKYTGFLERMLK